MREPPALSGVVITCNEADRIARCLRSLLPVCREVIVLDSGSTDDTVSIARALGARVEHRDWDGFSKQKNAAIAMASQPWVILLDADEWLEPAAQATLHDYFESHGKTPPVEQADCWLLLRRTHFLGTPMRFASFSREPVQRLFRQHLRHALRPVHEYLELEGQRVRESGVWLQHDTARSAEEYWRKLQGYALLWANEQARRGKTAWPGRGVLAGFAYALKNLVLRCGVLDGVDAMQFHWLHIRYVALKYRLLRQTPREKK